MITVIPAGKGKGYEIANSLRFRSSASAYLNRTPASAGNQKTWTWSAWVKRGSISSYANLFAAYSGSNVNQTDLTFTPSDALNFQCRISDVAQVSGTTTAVYRDPSAWYHIVVAVDTTQATNSNGVKIYVNGVQQSLTFTAYVQNTVTQVSGINPQQLGARYSSSPYYFDGYLAEINVIDGQALTPSSFGEIDATTGVWKPKQYSGTYGTNGFKLNFSNGTSTTTLGYDSSGNGNNWTTNNISLTSGATYDWMIDSPTSYAGTSYGVGNYAVLNPLWINPPTISGGNLNVTGPDNTAMASIGMPSGKWYFETTITTVGAISVVGICGTQPTATNYPGFLSDGYAYISNGNKQTNNVLTAYGSTYTSGDVIGCAFDADSGSLTFYKNGVSLGVAYSSIPIKTYYFAVYGRTTGGANNCSANFGQRPFSYTPPTGFKALCTYNLPTPTIQNGASHIAATTYTGNGSPQSIVNAGGFQPDLVWIKSRSAATDNKLTDVIRGVTKGLISNSTGAETTDINGVTAFNSNGFNLGSTGGAPYNATGATYIAWQWKANGTAVSNTAGSITSQVSANTTAGFSVVAYTGTGANATVGHGLGVAPSMVIVKLRSAAATNWAVYHESIGATWFLSLNTTDNRLVSSTVWNNTPPTSSVFSIGTSTSVNTSSGTHIAYCFAAIAGYSALGSYTGNGSTDGPFVYCGFRPRFVLMKRTDTTGLPWVLEDTSRDTYNATGLDLFPNNSGAEIDERPALDIVSNGFKLRNTYSGLNASGGTYIYAAFAENPLNVALAR